MNEHSSAPSWPQFMVLFTVISLCGKSLGFTQTPCRSRCSMFTRQVVFLFFCGFFSPSYRSLLIRLLFNVLQSAGAREQHQRRTLSSAAVPSMTQHRLLRCLESFLSVQPTCIHQSHGRGMTSAFMLLQFLFFYCTCYNGFISSSSLRLLMSHSTCLLS